MFWSWHVLFSFQLTPTQLTDDIAVCGLWGDQWPVNLRAARKIYGQHVDLRVARKSTTSHLPGYWNGSTVVPAWRAVAPGNPMLWRGVPGASIQKSFGSSGRDWKPWKKIPIPCKFCTYRFIRYSSTCYGKVRINPLMANTRNPDFFASPVANAAWFVVVRPCYLNRDWLSGPKGN